MVRDRIRIAAKIEIEFFTIFFSVTRADYFMLLSVEVTRNGQNNPLVLIP